MLAEPMPTRDRARASSSTRRPRAAPACSPGSSAKTLSLPPWLASEALQIMHFDVADGTALPAHAEALVDSTRHACVAACYRCSDVLLQPAGPRAARPRDEAAREMLLRLAGARPCPVARAIPAASGRQRRLQRVSWLAERSP